MQNPCTYNIFVYCVRRDYPMINEQTGILFSYLYIIFFPRHLPILFYVFLSFFVFFFPFFSFHFFLLFFPNFFYLVHKVTENFQEINGNYFFKMYEKFLKKNFFFAYQSKGKKNFYIDFFNLAGK